VTGKPIECRIGERRPGDPPRLVADSTKAQQTLGWRPEYVEIEPIIRTAWNWHSRHPHGYSS
jgi:UDP-glucose 4-epimerase